MFISRRAEEFRQRNADNVYKRLENLNRELKEGKKYRIKHVATKRKENGGSNKFEGTLVKKYESYYLFKNRSRHECFLKVDFAIGEYQIKEVR